MSTSDDFPGLFEAGQRASKAVDVLRSAIEQLHPPRGDEDWAEVAQRLRGASVLAHTAGLELAVICGWHEAASEASESGIMESK
jgi:hypothetical protein